MDPVRDKHYREQLMKQTTEYQATIGEVNRLKRKYLRQVKLNSGFHNKTYRSKIIASIVL